jgi:type VI secretion system protein ImpJ
VLDSGLPYFWGVGDLEIVPGQLVNNVIELTRATLLFRDGTYIEFPGNALIPPRSFEGAWVDGDKPFTVYVGLRRLSEVEPNVTVVKSLDAATDVNTRYVTTADPDNVADVYADGPSAQVKHLNHVVRLFWESELANAEQYDTVPVARLERDGEAIRISARFIPPCFVSGASDALVRLVKEIRDSIAGRTRQLEEYKAPREMQKAEFDASYMVYLLALRSLNRYTPLLFHYTETRQVHPWQIYGTLRQLVGELSSFSERFNMLGETAEGEANLPVYDHQDIGRCMSSASSLITQMLNELTIGPELLVHMQLNADGYYEAELSKSFFGARNRYYIVMRTESEPEEAVRSFLSEAKVGTSEQLPTLISRALPGIETIHMPAAPQGLPRRAYSIYFRIEQVSDGWSDVEHHGNLAIYWSSAPADVSMDVVVLRR